MPKRILILALIGCVGCAASHETQIRPDVLAPSTARVALHGESRQTLTAQASGEQDPGGQTLDRQDLAVDFAEPTPANTPDESADHLSLVDFIQSEEPFVASLSPAASPTRSIPSTLVQTASDQDEPSAAAASSAVTTNGIEMNLPSALAMVGGQHPVVSMARWRVQQAYAQLAQAEAMWLPTIQAGFSFHRHDGNYQASNGEIVDVNRNSFQYGLGAGATGAGTTPLPGLVARFHLADAIFQPRVEQTTAWAQGHAANATLNRQLLGAALAYTELLSAHQDVGILDATRSQTDELAKITRDFAEAGQGLQADADRMQTELALVENRRIAGQERIEIASARLAQAISLDGADSIVPMDVTVIPLEMSGADLDTGSMVATGLSMRPELKESQALVAAACEAYQREKYAPFVPSVLLGFSTGGFGGGLGNDLEDVDGRYDFDAVVSWQVRNLGFGEKAARRGQTARVQQAKFERIRVMDQVAREVREAAAQVRNRRQQIDATRRAVAAAEDSYDRNLKRIRDAEGLPIEVLQSLQALESARRAYLQAVVDFNQAQFRLQWAQGWPVQAPGDQPGRGTL